ncbi:hypothetical protein TWF506_001527 [Arthrobotrys conoides]|uniref:F-box domain-containing protein n=1 Tax=Arthrobotrys conoides TaxID=74498 RepID=A0AAN8NHF7_9PEZI
MSVTMLSLPNEILSNIFNDRCLSNADLTRFQLTCKLFRDSIKRQTSRRYTFRVDTPDQSPWRLIRYLLKNPTLGQHISEITVQWERRDASDKDTWTNVWIWEEEELQEIVTICEKWNIDARTEKAIGCGKNSEALLALLLVFTTNLKYLDLGGVQTGLVDHSYQDWGNGVALQAIGGSIGGDVKEDFDLELRENTPKHLQLFLYENLPYKLRSRWTSRISHTYKWNCERLIRKPHRITPDPDSSILPGLASLQHFRIGSGSGPRRGGGSTNLNSSTDVFQFFFLPEINIIQAFEVSSVNPYPYQTWSEPDNSDHYQKGSPIKHLVLESINRERRGTMFMVPIPVGQVRVETFSEAVAGVTGNLESVRLQFGGDSQKNEALGRLYLSNNKETLLPTKVIVDGDGFDGEGRFIREKERKKALALKQKLWEKTRGHAQLNTLNIKLSRLETLQPDILSKLASFLDQNDALNLFLSSKNFQNTRYRYNWIESRLNNSSAVSSRDLKLYQMSHNLRGFINIGWSNLNFGGDLVSFPDITKGGVGDPDFSNLRTTLEAIKNGDVPGLEQMKLDLTSYQSVDGVTRQYRPTRGMVARDLESESESESDPPNGLASIFPLGQAITSEDVPFNKHTTFLNILKSFSKQETSRKFQLHVRIELADISILRFCDMTRLTNLQLSEIWKGRQKSIGKSIDRLIPVLSGLKNQLRTLSLEGNTYGQMASKELEPADMWDKLQVLQEAVWEMKSLRSLTVLQDYLFHPSFILLPPKGVTSLTYMGQMSAVWWRKFASYPFTGVEHLKLNCSSLVDEDIEYLRSSGEEICWYTGAIKLGNIQISGLRWIEFDNLRKLSRQYPNDFVQLVLQNNPRISNHSLKVIMREISDRYSGRLMGKYLGFVEREHQKISEHLNDSFFAQKNKYIMEHLLAKKPIPGNRTDGGLFEAEMDKVVAEQMVKEFEGEFMARFAKESVEALRKSLGI